MTDGVCLSFTDKVFETKLPRVHLQLLGDQVRVRVNGKGSRHSAGTTVVTPRNSIRINLKKLKISVVDAILPAGVVPRGQRGIGLECAVGAAGMNRAQRTRDDAAIAFQ